MKVSGNGGAVGGGGGGAGRGLGGGGGGGGGGVQEPATKIGRPARSRTRSGYSHSLATGAFNTALSPPMPVCLVSGLDDDDAVVGGTNG